MTAVKDVRLSSMEYATAGGLSGFITRFSCQPLDVLKILFQLQADPKATSKYTSITQAVSVIVKEEGVSALWKGHVPAQLLSVSFGAIQFASYEKIIELSQKFETSNNMVLNKTGIHFYAGAASGVTAIVLSFPFDNIRTRLIAQPKLKLYKGFFDAVRQIFIHEGVRGYFRGLLPACLHIMPSSGLTFGFKNIYNELWRYCFVNESELCQITAKGHLITGLLSGVTSKMVVFPLDVVKKRLQIQGMDASNICLNTKSNCTSLTNALSLIIRNDGILGLYRGITPAIIKAGVANAIYFTLYSEICHLLVFIKR